MRQAPQRSPCRLWLAQRGHCSGSPGRSFRQEAQSGEWPLCAPQSTQSCGSSVCFRVEQIFSADMEAMGKCIAMLQWANFSAAIDTRAPHMDNAGRFLKFAPRCAFLPALSPASSPLLASTREARRWHTGSGAS